MDQINNKVSNEKKYMVVTYGCQMNEHDSEKISWILEEMGYVATDDKKKCDLIIYNTCAVRKSAEDKVLGKLGELKKEKRENPNLILAVCGCMMQRQEIVDIITSKYKQVDIIFGTNNIQKLPQLVNKHLQTGDTVVDIIEDTREIDENIASNRKHDFKAYVNIIHGCNNFCTYCIVPYTRGREVSRSPKHILEEIESLARNGCKEVTLLGQNVNSYGKTLDEQYNFSDLLGDINKIDGIERIRFMTSHPKDISDELISDFGKLEKLCDHLHLPVQSGSNRILKLMNRKYTKEDYLEKIDKIRKVNPKISITTDIIVGFPGETEEDFEETLDLVRKVKFDSAYTFLYSIREGTPAAKIDTQVADKIKHQRFQRLVDLLREIGLNENEDLLNQTVSVLVDGESKNFENTLNGRTSTGKLVNFKGSNRLIGNIVNIRIENVGNFSLEGTVI